MTSGNYDCESSLKQYISQTAIDKLHKTILLTDSISFDYLIEIINKISIDEIELVRLIKKIILNREAKNIKIPMIMYIIIFKINPSFLSDSIEEFNECEFVLSMYNLALMNNALDSHKFYLTFLMLAFYILKLRFNENQSKLLESLIPLIKNEHDSLLFYQLYSYERLTDILDNNDLICLLINSFDSNASSNYYFDISKITFFYHLLIKSQYERFIDLSKLNQSDFLLFPNQSRLLNAIIKDLYHVMNTITKLFLYGPKSSGKTSFAKLLLSDPLIIEVDESIETNYLLGGYLINEFSEIIWQDGILISALKEGRDILLLSMEKTGNDLLCILKQVLEKNTVFIPSKQEQMSNFNSRIIMVYNAIDKQSNDHKPLFTFFKSNSFPFYFEAYTLNNMIAICEWKYHLNDISKDILMNLILEYNTIPTKNRITSRYRKMTLNDILKFSRKIQDIMSSNSIGNDFISEKNQMVIVSQFIYNTLFTIDDANTLKEIAKGFCERFNFSIEAFDNIVFNIEEKFTYDTNPFNSVTSFDSNEKIMFNSIPKGAFYSYNSNSKFYIKLINMFVLSRDNILLVGETGVGKTRMIQNLASLMNIKLNVINLSQSSDESDLFGGYKPVTIKHFLKKYFDEIIDLLKRNFNMEKNKAFINSLCSTYANKKESTFVKFCICALDKILVKITEDDKQSSNIDRKRASKLKAELIKFQSHLNKRSSNAFKYIEGILLQSIKNDEWILLDEINLANDDMLLKLKSILEGNRIFLMNDNKISSYQPINKFRIFGSMNPEFNIGKKRLPNEVREFFSELFIREISSLKDIQNFVWEYLNDIPSINTQHIEFISAFYKEIKELQSSSQIIKADMSKCSFSLRTLTRTLISIRNGIKIFHSVNDTIYEAIAMNFISQIEKKSQKMLSFVYDDFKLNIDTIISYSTDSNFILTPMFRGHLETLIRIVTLSDYAVLLEGPTSCGKTSIVEFLAKCLNQKILRINNNQNTEVEEYLGTYTTDSNGNFYFNEGFLVKAVREGRWVILDEINLAPSEVLEALNRLLDDNRELYLPESNTVIKAHNNFRIFAAMNPSEIYAGRKDLSDAFKNRFIHLFFDNIPHEELITIIEKRCKVPKSRADIMVNIFSQLQLIRSKEQVFQKNESFITIRDLIKWGMRDINTYDKLAIEGYILLAEKLRSNEEKVIVRNVIEQQLKNKKISIKNEEIDYYYLSYEKEKFCLSSDKPNDKFQLTQSMMRMLVLVDKAIINHEAVLLIGETGTGKTLACEFLSKYYQRKLITVNCHENMDTNDFLGSLRSCASSTQLFEWVDGPVTSAMKNGFILLIDEISLVLDSVLERMNSIFEADSVLVLSEKNIDQNIEVIKPHQDFIVIATMSPSCEYGKKELSVALRARFTEIYIGDISIDDIRKVIAYKVASVFSNLNYNSDANQVAEYSNRLIDIYYFYNSLSKIQKPMTFRDIDIICEFIKSIIKKHSIMNINAYFSQAIQMTIIEGLYLNETLTPEILQDIKSQLSSKFNLLLSSNDISLIDNESHFGVENFLLEKSIINNDGNKSEFVFNTNTLKNNLLKILRGMSIKKPILIEGSPGVGKTTIIQNIAKKINKKIHRVNLSEHTDMIDLIGSQYPSNDGGFKWLDGVLLTSMKKGDWIIIDEMNLANQSILEGLNSVLDHRRTIFVPELNKEFISHENFQLFATQNPVNQGGGRKFLPKSFLNRFIKIYLDDLNDNDYKEILIKLYIDKIDIHFIHSLVDFNEEVKKEVKSKKVSSNEIGEFNLRTMIKFLQCYNKGYDMLTIANALYFGRIRRQELKQQLHDYFISIFNLSESKQYNLTNYFNEIKMCIECNYPIIISGEGNCGKKELIRKFYQAKVYDNNGIKKYIINTKQKININEFYLYSTMDSSELLGNFNKKNVYYNINQQKAFYYNNNKPKTSSGLYESILAIEELNSKAIKLKEETQSNYSFEWHDSILVKSIMNGEWIILDNVNTCSSAVLDRLNSLLDDDKSIFLNESGEGRVLSPNEAFRIFLVMNNALGEVSRALKNRCVELHYGGKHFQCETLIETDKVIKENSFIIDGNYDQLTISYMNKKRVIETELFDELIALSKMPFWISFNLIMSFMLCCEFNFQSLKQFIGLFEYFYMHNHTYKENRMLMSIIRSINIINYSLGSETNIDEQYITNIIDEIHSFFFNENIHNQLSPVVLELLQRYHFNAIIEQNDIAAFFHGLSAQSHNLDLINNNEKLYFNYFRSSSSLYSMILDSTNEKNIKLRIPFLQSILNYFGLNSYQIAFIYSIYQKGICAFDNETFANIDYPYEEISNTNIKKYILATEKFNSCINQLKKLISFTSEKDINDIKNSIISLDNLEAFYIFNKFISNICSKDEHIAFIRFNSDIFIYLMKMIINKSMKRHNIQNTSSMVIDDESKHIAKQQKITYSITKDLYDAFNKKFIISKHFTINQEIVAIYLNFTLKTVQFKNEEMNEIFLKKLFCDTTSELSMNNNEISLIPLISQKIDLNHIQQLIEMFNQTKSFLNANELSLIERLIDDSDSDSNSLQSLESIIESFLTLNYSKAIVASKLLEKNFFIWSYNILNYKSEWYYPLAMELIRLKIIDQYTQMLNGKLSMLFNANEIEFALNTLIKNKSLSFYLYPFIYFYTKLSYENIEHNLAIVSKILSFDCKALLIRAINKIGQLCNIEFNSLNGDNDELLSIANQLRNKLSPSKEIIFETIGKPFKKSYNEIQLECYSKLSFTYQFLNKQSNKNYDEILLEIQSKLNKFNQKSFYSNDNQIFQLFIKDIDLLNQNLNRVFLDTFINDYLLYFTDIILPKVLIEYVIIMLNNTHCNKSLTLSSVINIDFNPTIKRDIIINRMNMFKSFELKIEYLMRIANKYNKDIIISIYQELHQAEEDKSKMKEDSLSDMKVISQRIKKYVSLEEKVMENTSLIGQYSKEEKEDKEKEEEIKEINERFPQYDNQFNIYSKQPTSFNQFDINDSDKEKIDTVANKSFNHHIQIFIFLCNIYSIQTEINQGNIIVSNNDWYSYIESFESNSIMSFLHKKFNFYKSNALFNDYEGNIYQYTTNASILENEGGNIAHIKSTNNFYLEANPSQMKILFIPLNSLLSKCSFYLSQFEDHPVLIGIVFICNSILSLDMNSTPLAKVLSGIDLLLIKLHEWEAYSSKQLNSLQNEIDVIMRVIRHYRKIEVLSWKNFFLTKEQELLKKDIAETFYEIFLKRNELISDIDFLNYFVMNSSIGNFNYRLNLLRVLAESTQSKEAKNVLNNIYQYYNINYVLSKRLDKFREGKIGEIEDKIKSLTKIAKWDIKNYFNFRDNMKRNYKQLNKLLKQNENMFSAFKLSDIIQSSRKEYSDKEYIFEKLATQITIADKDKEKKNKDDDSNHSSFSNDNNEDVIYDEFILEITNRIDGLKKLNRSKSNTKAFKTKALIDLIKKVQSLGLVKEYKFIQNEIFEKFKSLTLTHNTQSAYICKILEKINNYSNLTSYSIDLNSHYFDRMKGLAFSCFDNCLRIFIHIQQLKDKIDLLITDKYKAITRELSNDLIVKVNNCDKIINVFQAIKEFLCEINTREIDEIYKDKPVIQKQFSKQFNDVNAYYSYMIKFFEFNTNINNGLPSNDLSYLTNVFKLIKKGIYDILLHIENHYPILLYQYQTKGERLINSIDDIVKENNSIISHQSNETVIDYNEAIIQYVSQYENTIKYTEEEKKLIEIFKVFYLKNMNDDDYNEESPQFSFGNVIQTINTIEKDMTVNNSLTKLLMITLEDVNTIFLSILKLSNLTISIFYNVTLNGYCKNEQDEAKQSEASGVQEGGFGMADAEGLEDITKQIDDEEQLLGLQDDDKKNNDSKEQKNKGNENNKEEEDNAFEMKTDFKESERREMERKEDEEENIKNKDDSNIEREEGSVDNEEDNQMYDDDNSLNDEEDDKKEDKTKKTEIDLTDKNIQTKGNDKDDIKAKSENDKSKDNEKNVDKDNHSDEDDNNDSENSDNVSNKDKEKKKVEKIDVDKENKEKKDINEDNENEDENGEDIEMTISKEDKNNEDKKNQNETESQIEDEQNEIIMPDNDKEIEMNDDENKEEEDDDSSESSNNNIGVNQEMEIDNDENNLDEDAKLKSNPVQTKEKDLGYNPLTSNEGNGGNTAQQTKDNLTKAEDDQNTDPNLDELKDLEQLKEIFDINSILDSIWTSRPNIQKQNRKDNKTQQNQLDQQEKNKDENEPIDNFNYEKYNEMNNDQQQKDNQLNSNTDFNQGYTTEFNDNITKTAKGNAKDNNDSKNSIEKKKDNQDIQLNKQNDHNEEDIQLYENDQHAEIIDTENEYKDNPINNNTENDMPIDEENKNTNNDQDKNNIINLNENTDQRQKSKLIISMEDKEMEIKGKDTISNIDSEINKQSLDLTIQTFNNWIKSQNNNDPHQLLSQIESLSHSQILKLTELLKIALEPNKQTKLKGNFKTGKRLNMKRIISFIASNYRQDKIWLRRTLPFERDYLITIAIDDSLSMKEHNLGFFAMQSLVILSSALRKLSIGKVSVCSIKDQMLLLNSFEDQLSREKLSYILSQYKFDFSSRTSHDFAMMNFMSQSIKTLESVSVFQSNVNQIVFIFSDGRFNKKNCRTLCNQAKEKGLLYIFIILDQYGIESKNSILNTMSVDIDDMSVKPYLEDFPFQYYVVVQDPGDLPEVVQTILLKWFSIMN